MLITQVKKKEEILPFLKGEILLIACFGCKEVHFAEKEYETLKEELKAAKLNISGEIKLDYLCNEEYTRKRLDIHKNEITAAVSVVIFSCGVGVQTFAGLLPDKVVLSGCDTFYVPGFSGFTPSSCDCEQCGECMLGYTVGICPVTACSKGLLNGQCGGAKNGKCEVSKNKECGWERIFNRMLAINESDKNLKEMISIRDYKKSQ
ncbi:MAG: 5,10-methylene tetrahydromethanopterin reductase [Candidatus Firestonebacteria bacterium RIFOXYC2_FULL_39_67]|nr:MAG: 5,10-methylene tetrahydromethanopterin reductase [Candidatus Firestonebacteria bacterium RIFOXYD2_FULL_39_29]OGF53910.1 MAG: 5,10-methylene tetrahydromethanopterin reductase [Candidatus Firestonebacteria bacterium RIFOXYC2_FULL_39_67]